MPCYNERGTIREIVSRVLAVDIPGVDKEIVIVDDGSRDGTRDILAELDGRDGVRVLLQAENQGKGAAVARGIRESTGDVADHPGRRPRVRPARVSAAAATDPRGPCRRRLRLALSRFAARPPRAVFLAFDRQPALTLLSNAFTDLNLTDMETCYKMFVRDIADRLDLQSQGFRHRARDHLQGRAPARARLRGARSPITGAPTKKGRRSGSRDAFKAVWVLFEYARWEAPESDVGAITLRRMATLSPYNRWLHERFEHYLGSRILEVGSGVGNQTQALRRRPRAASSPRTSSRITCAS